MGVLMAAFNPLDRIFLLCAVLGGFMFIAKTLIGMLFGGDGDVDMDVDALEGAGGHDFRVLSLQTVTAFFIVFGLLGLTLHQGAQLGEAISVLGAFAGGFAMMLVMAKIMQMMKGLHSSGNLRIADAVGKQGMVYLRIPEGGGIGKVQVDINNRLVEMDAMSTDKTQIDTGERISVTEVVNQNLLIVKKYEPETQAG